MRVSTLLQGPGLRGIVVASVQGELVGEVGADVDPQQTAAVAAVVGLEFGQAGIALGLGGFVSATLKTPRRSRVLAQQGNVIAILDLQPDRPTADIEAILRDSDWASELQDGIADLSSEIDEIELDIDTDMSGADGAAVVGAVVDGAVPDRASDKQIRAGTPVALPPRPGGEPALRAYEVPPHAHILDDTWDVGAALQPLPSDPSVELRRALAHADIDTAESVGSRLYAPPGDGTGAENTDPDAGARNLEALRILLAGIGASRAGDGRGAIEQWRAAEPPPSVDVSIRWARQIWLALNECAAGLPLERAKADADLALELASSLDDEAKSFSLLTEVQVALSWGRNEEALSFLAPARELFVSGRDDARIADAWLLKARALAGLGKDEESRAAASKAHGVQPTWPMPALFMAQQALKSGGVDKAEGILRPFLSKTPRAIEVDRMSRILALVRKREMTAEHAYEFLQVADGRPAQDRLAKLSEWSERFAHCYVMRAAFAGMLLRMGEYERAVKELTQVSLQTDLNPEERSSVLLTLGCLSTERSRHERTGVKLRAAVLATPEPLRSSHTSTPPSAPAMRSSSPAAQQGLGVLAESHNVLASGQPDGLPGTRAALQGSVFSGSLAVFGITDLLEFLRNGQRTGTLVCASASGIGALQLRLGRITGGASPNTRGIGDCLVSLGALKEDQLAGVLRRHPPDLSNKKLLGAVLIEEQLVTPEVVREALRRQVSSAVREIMTWSEGSFAFDAEGLLDEAASEFDIDLDPQAVLLNIFKELDEGAR